MDVRRKLLGAFLAAAGLIAVAGGVVLSANAISVQHAAAAEAGQLARGIAEDIAEGLPTKQAGEKSAPPSPTARPGSSPSAATTAGRTCCRRWCRSAGRGTSSRAP